MVKTMFADGDIPPPPTYPRQEVLIVQGKYAEAADWFRDHLRIEPGDHEARLQLAHLLEMRLGRYDEAGRLYLEMRNAGAAADQYEQMRATNGLVDMHRDRGGRGVAVFLNIAVDLIVAQLGGLLHHLDDPLVGLMRDEELDIGGSEAVGLERDGDGLRHLD